MEDKGETTLITSVSSLDCMSKNQLVQALMTFFEGHLEYNTERLSKLAQVDLIELIERSFKYKQQLLHTPRDSPAIFCLNSKHEIVCWIEEAQLNGFPVRISPDIEKRYLLKPSVTKLDERDKLKILYQLHIGCKENNVLSLPWTALTLSQSVAIAQERETKIDIEKSLKSPNPAGLIASQLKKSLEFTKQFGSCEKFEACALFGFSIEAPLDLDLGVTDNDGTRDRVKLLRHWFKKLDPQGMSAEADSQSHQQDDATNIATMNASESQLQSQKPEVKIMQEKREQKKCRRVPQLDKNTRKMGIEMKNDLSFVVRDPDYAPLVTMGRNASELNCTICKHSCRNETLTCSVCLMEVHYKCYPSQLYKDNSGRKKRKTTAMSTFTSTKKMKNLFWRCNDCDGLDIVEHILFLATEELRSTLTQVTDNDDVEEGPEDSTLNMAMDSNVC